MRKRGSILIVFVIVILAGGAIFPGCNRQPLEAPAQEAAASEVEMPTPAPPDLPEPVKQSAWELRFETWPMEFGFANEEGSKLIHPFYEYLDPEETDIEKEIAEEHEEGDGSEATTLMEKTGFDPDRFSLAIGTYSEMLPIHFSKWQDEKSGNNGRENANNFNNLPGFVYGQKDWKLKKNKTYLMTGMDTLIDSMFILSPPGWKGNTPPMDNEIVERIESETGRGIIWTKTLAFAFNGTQVGVVLFERQGNDMLFSIVYIDEDRILFWNNPAEYDETSTWRVDAGEEPGNFEPLVLARFNEGLFLVLLWGAPEGETVLVLYEEDGVFLQAENLQFARYMP